MLQIIIPATELFNEKNGEFVKSKEQVLQLEHSLVSLSKWESKWSKPFMTKTEKTLEETIDYIRCMTITQNVDYDVYNCITDEIIKEVSEYIEAPMTATTFGKDNSHTINRDIITAEIIYYWMVTLNVPFECQKWHLNRLLTLINVCNIKNQPKKKMGKRDIYSQNRAINAARKSNLNTTG
jgi:hypothetical protein